MAALALVGCNENDVESAEFRGKTVTLDISLDCPQTRSTSSADDSAISNVQIFIFDQSGTIEAYRNGGNEPMKFQCTAGPKDIVAIVNGPSMAGISTLDQLKQQKSDLLADNAPGSLVMEGHASFTVDVSQTENPVKIQVKRLAARISLGSINVDFETEYYKSKEFKVQGIYLINVAGEKTLLAESTDVNTWYNKLTLEDVGKNSLIYDALSENIADGGSYTGEHNFYCYPNPSADSSDATWSPRSTRYVVEAMLGTEVFYYPVTMPVIEQNTAYKINLTIKRPGSTTPDVPVQTYWGEGSVEVVGWGDVNVIDKEI